MMHLPYILQQYAQFKNQYHGALHCLITSLTTVKLSIGRLWIRPSQINIIHLQISFMLIDLPIVRYRSGYLCYATLNVLINIVECLLTTDCNPNLGSNNNFNCVCSFFRLSNLKYTYTCTYVQWNIFKIYLQWNIVGHLTTKLRNNFCFVIIYD